MSFSVGIIVAMSSSIYAYFLLSSAEACTTRGQRLGSILEDGCLVRPKDDLPRDCANRYGKMMNVFSFYICDYNVESCWRVSICLVYIEWDAYTSVYSFIAFHFIYVCKSAKHKGVKSFNIRRVSLNVSSLRYD